MTGQERLWTPPTERARQAVIEVCEYGLELLLAHRRAEKERRRREEVRGGADPDQQR